MGKWPKLAYYWPSDSMISASAAIEKGNSIVAQGSSGAMLNVTKPIQGMAAIVCTDRPAGHIFGLGLEIKQRLAAIMTSPNQGILNHTDTFRCPWPIQLARGLLKRGVNLSSVRKSRLSTADIVLEHSPIGEMVRTSTYVLVRDKIGKEHRQFLHNYCWYLQMARVSCDRFWKSWETIIPWGMGKTQSKEEPPQFLRKKKRRLLQNPSHIQAEFQDEAEE